MAVLGVLAALVGGPQREAALALFPPPVVKQLEGVAQILWRKADMERKYLARLEGQPPEPAAVGVHVILGCRGFGVWILKP